MNHIASMVKRGYTFDPECARATHRIGVARGLLHARGFVPVFTHCDRCPRHPRNARSGMRDYGCWAECVTVWPVEVTDGMFEAVALEADAIQTANRVPGLSA